MRGREEKSVRDSATDLRGRAHFVLDLVKRKARGEVSSLSKSARDGRGEGERVRDKELRSQEREERRTPKRS